MPPKVPLSQIRYSINSRLLLFSRLVVSDSFVTPWTAACQALLSVGFSRQEYWSGLPCPPPGDLPNPAIEPGSPALHADSLPAELPGKPSKGYSHNVKPGLQVSSFNFVSFMTWGNMESLINNCRKISCHH